MDPATVRRWVASEKLAAIKLPSGQARIPRAVVNKMLGEHAEADVADEPAEQVPA